LKREADIAKEEIGCDGDEKNPDEKPLGQRRKKELTNFPYYSSIQIGYSLDSLSVRGCEKIGELQKQIAI
jgi:hypothetical protein